MTKLMFSARKMEPHRQSTLVPAAAPHTINVGSNAPSLDGDLNSVDGRLMINADGGNDTLNVDDSGDLTDNGPGDVNLSTDDLSGYLTETVDPGTYGIYGLGMGSPGDQGDRTRGIEFQGLELLNIDLGSGSDSFTIENTTYVADFLNSKVKATI